MNGLGLPVCYAACPGPRTDWATDGESMVSLGAMPAPDEYLARNSGLGAYGDEGMVRAIDGETDGADTRDRGLCESLLSAMMRCDGRTWNEMRRAMRAGHLREMARTFGLSLRMITHVMRSGSSDSRRARTALVSLFSLDGRDWECLRHIMQGNSLSRVAALTGVSKQAVSKQYQRIKRKMRRSHNAANMALCESNKEASNARQSVQFQLRPDDPPEARDE